MEFASQNFTTIAALEAFKNKPNSDTLKELEKSLSSLDLQILSAMESAFTILKICRRCVVEYTNPRQLMENEAIIDKLNPQGTMDKIAEYKKVLEKVYNYLAGTSHPELEPTLSTMRVDVRKKGEALHKFTLMVDKAQRELLDLVKEMKG